jgi:hypothetical protein
MKSILLLSIIFGVSIANRIVIWNHCPFTIWPGVQSNQGHPLPAGGGFQLDAYKAVYFDVPGNWVGRIWARTKCEGGHCETGDCGKLIFWKKQNNQDALYYNFWKNHLGNRIQCNGAGGQPPASLAEIQFQGSGGQDFYDVSLVDGYNLPIAFFPSQGTPSCGVAGVAQTIKVQGIKFKGIHDLGHYAIRPAIVKNRTSSYQHNQTKSNCGAAGCNRDLNAICPGELAIKNSAGWTIACKSACLAFNTDQYCCRGAYGTSDKCNPSDWPVNYPAIFKKACPAAYSYAYDDRSSLFTCKSGQYQITFCPWTDKCWKISCSYQITFSQLHFDSISKTFKWIKLFKW